MISYSLRLLFDWITVQMCFAGDKSKMLLSLLKTGSDEDSGSWTHLTERLEQQYARSKMHFITYCSCFILLCMDVYMQANAWQRSCVRSPAIKKSPRGKGGRWGGERRKPAEEEEEEEGEGRRQRRRLFFLRSEAAERSRRGKAGEWENGAESGGIAPGPSSQTLHSVLLDSALLGSVLIGCVQVVSGLVTGF